MLDELVLGFVLVHEALLPMAYTQVKANGIVPLPQAAGTSGGINKCGSCKLIAGSIAEKQFYFKSLFLQRLLSLKTKSM